MRKTSFFVSVAVLALCLVLLVPVLSAADTAETGVYYESMFYYNRNVTIETVRIISGSIPPGLSLEWGDASVLLLGTPTDPGEYSITVEVTDADTGLKETAQLNLVISGEAISNPIEPPVISSQPSDVTVNEGDSCSFSVKFTYTDYCTWIFQTQDGIEYSVTEIQSALKGLTVSGDGSYKLSLSNVPYELNGWKVYCICENDAHAVKSDRAVLTVKKKATATPSPTPKVTKKATTTPTPAPTATPIKQTYSVSSVSITAQSSATPSPTASATPGPHVHDFSGAWVADEKNHWHACSCGEIADVTPHTFTWSEGEDGIRRGTCSACGAVVRASGSKNSAGSLLFLIIGIAGGLVLLASGIVVGVILSRKKHKNG